MKSSSESMPVVTGVGGAGAVIRAAEATLLLFARSPPGGGETIDASAAFLFLVKGEMLTNGVVTGKPDAQGRSGVSGLLLWSVRRREKQT